MNPTKHIDGIDGLRGMSIIFVVIAHTSYLLPGVFRHGAHLGLPGVTIFFVISGYLITSKLQAEKARSGTISLTNFILGRIFRLMPASLFLIGTAVLLNHFGIVGLTSRELLHALTYTMDYIHPTYHTLEHLWSLSVEEQFYLIWPIILLIAGYKRSTAACIAAVFLCPLLRGIMWHSGLVDPMLIFRRFEFVFDSLAIGCLLSLIEARLPQWLRSSFTSIICLFVILLNCLVIRYFNPYPIISITLDSICSGLLINSLTNPELSISKCFAWMPLKWIGTISYSLYLWQQLFLTPRDLQLPPAWLMALRFLGAVAMAVFSFYVIERPIRAWGKRFHRPINRRAIDMSGIQLVNR